MPDGKVAGEACIQLNEKLLCKLFEKPERPEVCLRFSADIELCGNSNKEALANIERLERLTR